MDGKQSAPKPAGGKPAWLLFVAALIAVAAGAAYLTAWMRGLRETELLGFTAIWVAIPLAVSLILMFSYLNRPARS